MTKIIVSGGCSFAYGYSLKDREKRYASLIASQLGCDILDVSVAGSSNDNIAASVAYGLNKALLTHNPKDILVMIGWTEVSRYEYWNKHIARIQTIMMHWLPSDKEFLERTKLVEIRNFVRENMWEPCYSYYKTLHAFNYIHNLCKARGVNVVHIKNLEMVKARMPDGVINHASMRQENYTNGVLSLEDAAEFSKMFNSISCMKFLSILFNGKDRKYIPSDLYVNPPLDNHPTELGHRLWADEIFKRYSYILIK